MSEEDPKPRWLRTPRQSAIDRLTFALAILLGLVTLGVVLSLGPAEALGRIARAF